LLLPCLLQVLQPDDLYPSMDELLASQPDLSMFREVLRQLNLTTLWGDNCTWSGVHVGMTPEEFVQLPNDTCLNASTPSYDCTAGINCYGNAAGTYAFELNMGTMALPTNNVSARKCIMLLGVQTADPVEQTLVRYSHVCVAAE
jgi:hypothetical protein